MLTRSVNTCKRLLMKKTGKSPFVGNLLHHFHSELVMIDRHIRSLKNRCQLVL